MKYIATVAGVVVGIGVLGLVSSAAFANRDFVIINHTDQKIVAAQVSSPNLPYWYDLEGQKITPGQQEGFHLTTDDLENYCQVQLRVQFADGSQHEWNDGFNMCRTTYIDIEYDSGEGSYVVYYK